MSFNEGNQTDADHIPGAFPSEDEVMSTEKTSHNSQSTTSLGSKTTTGGNVDEKKKDFLEQQEAAHTAGGWQSDKHIPGSVGEQREDRPKPISSQLEDKNLSQEPRHAGLETSTSGSRTAEAFGDGQNNARTTAQDESSIGSNLATMATAVGLAAKDAVVAAKDSAGPAASAATEQAKNLVGYGQENTAPSANNAAEQAGNTAAYTRNAATSGASSGSRDTVPTGTAMQTAGSAATYAKDTAYSAANTAQSYAPSVLGEPSNTGSSTRDHGSGFAASQPGESLESTRAAPVESKSRLENQSLGQSQTQETKRPQANPTSRVKDLEEQMLPESTTPGVVTVLGTEQDRSFPLGATDHVVPT